MINYPGRPLVKLQSMVYISKKETHLVNASLQVQISLCGFRDAERESHICKDMAE